jgi:hypothetical protein
MRYLIGILILIAWVALRWGWTVVGAAAIVILARGTIRRSAPLTAIALLLAVLSAGWFVVARPLIWDVVILRVRDPGGDAKLTVVKSLVNHLLVYDRRGEIHKFKLKSGPGAPRPESVFWIDVGKSVGVDYGKGEHWIVDVELLLSMETPAQPKLTDDVRRKLEYWRGRLTEEEEARFAEARDAGKKGN